MPLTLYYYFECERECACSNIQARVLSQIENFHYHISCTFPTTKDYWCIENETWLAHTECRVNPLYPVSNKKLSILLINKSIENLYNCSMIIP